MISWREECGLTLVELMVTMMVSLIVFGAVLSVLEIFQRQNSYDQQRNENQDAARSAIDRLTADLRDEAAPASGAAGTLEQVGPYDIVFQTVSATQVFGGSNAVNLMRVRYCLDASTPSNETLWRQTQTWTTASAPAAPITSSCPGPVSASAWSTKAALVSNVTNQYAGQSRPVFSCQQASSGFNTCSTTTTSTSQVAAVEIGLFVAQSPGAQPAETELTGGAEFRNVLTAPTAAFTLTQVRNNYVTLDGSGSFDANGAPLTYQWYTGSLCTSTNAITGATAQQYNSPTLATGTYSYTLAVTNSGGLTSCASPQSVTVQ